MAFRIKSREYVYKKVKSGSSVGRLTVLSIVGKSSNGSNMWSCLCDCGNTVEVISSSLNSGLTQSCGCLYNEIKGRQASTHGMSGTPTYNSWLAMRGRCYYTEHDYYEYYGGRGIKVCDRWLDSFENFLEDMGIKPDGLSLDRIDNNLDYSPNNCKWSTNSEQGFNTRMHSNNSSGKTGVSFHTKTNKWQATIGVDSKSIYLGVYDSFEEAVNVREAAEIEYFSYNKE